MKKGDVYDFMLLWQEVEIFKKKHKIIDVPFYFFSFLNQDYTEEDEIRHF